MASWLRKTDRARTSKPSVRRSSRTMVPLTRKATEAATALGVTAASRLSEKQKADYDMMAKLSGPAFDKMFAEAHGAGPPGKIYRQYQKAATAPVS